MLSILEKSNEMKADHDLPASSEQPQSKSKKSTSSMSGKSDKSTTSAPSWLNISLDAALGFRANVFQVTRTVPGGKKSSQSVAASGSSEAKTVGAINIHPGASAVVCRHTLDVLIALAKSFPTHYLPWKDPLAAALTAGLANCANGTSCPACATVAVWEGWRAGKVSCFSLAQPSPALLCNQDVCTGAAAAAACIRQLLAFG